VELSCSGGVAEEEGPGNVQEPRWAMGSVHTVTVEE
jgi:hypothetical protein